MNSSPPTAADSTPPRRRLLVLCACAVVVVVVLAGIGGVVAGRGTGRRSHQGSGQTVAATFKDTHSPGLRWPSVVGFPPASGLSVSSTSARGMTPAAPSDTIDVASERISQVISASYAAIYGASQIDPGRTSFTIWLTQLTPSAEAPIRTAAAPFPVRFALSRLSDAEVTPLEQSIFTFAQSQGLTALGSQESLTNSGVKVAVWIFHLTPSDLETLVARFGTATVIFNNTPTLPTPCTTCLY